MKIFCLLLVSVSLQAQPPVLLRDDFSSNKDGWWWTGKGENYSIRLERGKYIITTLQKDKGRYITISPFIDGKKDFSIEATFVQKSGTDNNGYGFMWGDNTNGKYHDFTIASTGYFRILSPEKREKLNEWIVTDKVKPLGGENRLKIEQRKARLYFYINSQLVLDVPTLPLYGTRLGFITHTNMVLEIDDFILRHDMKINLPPNLATGFVKENLGPHVNSPYDDLGPIITADGRTIYFGRENSPENMGGKNDGEDIYVTTSTDGVTWSKSKNLGPPINNTETNNMAAVSADNNMLMFCRSDGFQVRRRTKDGWSEPEYLNVRFKNEVKTMEANLSTDGKAIVFTAKLSQNLFYNPADDVREKDIYVTLQDGKGNWGAPVNLGSHINTAGDELSPFLAADGRTLYFASNGRPGYGSYDIYMSKRTGNSWTEWTEPVNLGPEINTNSFDAYYTISAAADYAIMVSDRNSHGASDLVRIKLPEAIKPDPVVLLMGRTLNAKTRQPVSADIYFEDLTARKEIGEAISDPKTGSYRIALTKGKNYGIRAEAKGYLSVNENFELASVTEYKEINKDLLLVPIVVGETIMLNNVFFQQGRPVLKSESFPELDRLVEIMRDNPTVKIELGGHTDNVGNKDALRILSENRVKAVKDYLVLKGISKDRVAGKGYGGDVPVVPNTNEANRQRNRRVEFKIVKK
ncbi:MAG: PD40 domain-containing protein [Cyclobacteriaceae bacterium]|nr:PD40 domain-containing protein [Cyclobacteriaceae bacterium]